MRAKKLEVDKRIHWLQVTTEPREQTPERLRGISPCKPLRGFFGAWELSGGGKLHVGHNLEHYEYRGADLDKIKDVDALIGAIGRVIRCTRIDYAVTIQTNAIVPFDYIKLADEGAMGKSKVHSVYETIGAKFNGQTVYVGHPTSDKRLTIYDKASESDLDSPAIRFELRLRGRWATAFYKTCQQWGYKKAGDATMWGIFSPREPIFKHALETHDDVRLDLEEKVTSFERWMRASIIPAIKKNKEKYPLLMQELREVLK